MSQHAHQKQRNWFARHKVLTGAGALVAVIAIGGALSGGSGGDAGTASGQSSGKSSGAEGGEKKGKKADASGNGTFQVGSDIKPGTYRSAGNKEGCYWERDKDSKGEADSILANDNAVGTSYVTIAASDKIFKSSGCKGWNLVTDAKGAGTTPATEARGNGMYRVGLDIAPGTYTSQGNKEGCYWERDKDALHSGDSVIANENVTGNGIVTLTTEDAYFKTSGCTDWKKTG
ncbi:hypothetical protein [Streptomyces sp. NPDC001678]|uniref:hypothetical protein n=1 Tax=Streptomyces sp. NPDC001678 TaxID=3364599 RepID=UPI0036ABEADA